MTKGQHGARPIIFWGFRRVTRDSPPYHSLPCPRPRELSCANAVEEAHGSADGGGATAQCGVEEIKLRARGRGCRGFPQMSQVEARIPRHLCEEPSQGGLGPAPGVEPPLGSSEQRKQDNPAHLGYAPSLIRRQENHSFL